EQVGNLVGGRLRVVGGAGVNDLRGANQHLAVPGQYKDLAAVGGFSVNGMLRSAVKFGQHQVRSAHAADQPLRLDAGRCGDCVRPRSARVDHLLGGNRVLLAGDTVAQASAGDAAMIDV